MGMKRREFVKQAGVIGAGAAMGLPGMTGEKAAVAGGPSGRMPSVNLGGLEVSRLILGSNPFWGYSHKSPALDDEMRLYHTDAVIMKILDEAAACGITAVASPPDPRWLALYRQYLSSGGKLRIWIAQCHGSPGKMPMEIENAVEGGAKAVFIQGMRVEEQFVRGRFEVLRSWIKRIKELGVPAGAAAHWPEIHPELERRQFPTDFYCQCFFNVSKGNAYRKEEREKAVETLLGIEKPVIAYKILGAGRLPANEGFEYAFSRIRRKDGVCVGIYARRAIDQIRQNVSFTETLSES